MVNKENLLLRLIENMVIKSISLQLLCMCKKYFVVLYCTRYKMVVGSHIVIVCYNNWAFEYCFYYFTIVSLCFILLCILHSSCSKHLFHKRGYVSINYELNICFFFKSDNKTLPWKFVLL